MTCRVGISVAPHDGINHWRIREGYRRSSVIASSPMYDEALAREQREAKAWGCEQSGSDVRVSGRVWWVYSVRH